MNITQPISNTLTNITLTPSKDFVFRLKADPRFHIIAAYVTDTVDKPAVRALFDEVSVTDIPKFNGKQAYDSALVAKTVAAITAAKTPDAATPDATAPAPWDKTIDYAINATVTDSGATYIALMPNKNNQPSKNPKYWAKI